MVNRFRKEEKERWTGLFYSYGDKSYDWNGLWIQRAPPLKFTKGGTEFRVQSSEFRHWLPLNPGLGLLIGRAGTTKNFNMFSLYKINASLPRNTDVFKKFRRG